jgi:hypothetical protein
MSDDIVLRAHRFLRAHTSGDLQFDEHVRPVRYVVTPDGRLVSSVMVAMIRAVETVLFVPAAEEDALELLVTLEQFEETGEAGAMADRWRIYHGDPEDVRWAYLDIDAARFESAVIDGEALMRPNDLAEEEARLCRTLNAPERREDLRRLARRAGAELEDPRVVGVDPDGLDIRGRFGVVRVGMGRAEIESLA